MTSTHDRHAPDGSGQRGMTGSGFGGDFLWGVAVSGYQSEGDGVHSDTWYLEHTTPTVFQQKSGRSINSWELWETDLDLAARLHLNAYRFSVEWSRVEPADGELDVAALDHYEAVVDGCHARGLAPVVTFNHFTNPHWFARDGGWLTGGSERRFADYCDAVMRRFGDRIHLAVTMNEPNLPRLLSWVLPAGAVEMQEATLDAAARRAGVAHYRTGNVVRSSEYEALQEALARAHVAAKEAIRSHRGDLPVGLSLAVVDDVAHGESPIRDRKRAEVYEPWLTLARADDFIGVQNYERLHYGPDGLLSVPEGAVCNEMGSAVDPASLAGAVRYVHDMAGVPVLVSEHGLSTADDDLRAGFLEPAIEGLRDVALDGVPVLGYCHWTLVDNYEWIAGFDSRLGLYAVDRTTFERSPKGSASEYARLVSRYRSTASAAGDGPL